MRQIRQLGTALVLATALISTTPVSACPMCKVALEDTEDASLAARPRAYMYSILFMLSMPATLVTVFGVSFYRLSKRQQAINERLLAEFESAGADQSAG